MNSQASVNSRFGPIRLVALNCGKFDYAEIELDKPLHLVGPNNVGKTSLIALLQFLYLDEQRSMRFSRDMQETRKYYFPTVFSYALFECLTPTGYQTIGVRGCGPVRQYEFERFAYTGRFEAGLFLDAKRRVKPFDTIRAELAAKAYTPLTPAALRAALTGVGDSRQVMLGLVPARNRDAYQSFRTLFCNILRLAHIRQEEMKGLLLALFAKRFHQPEGIDLARTYRENFEKVKRDTRDVQVLKDLVPDIDRVLEHRDKRDASRGRLPALYTGIQSVAQATMNALQQARAKLAVRRETLESNTRAAEAAVADNQSAREACTRDLTRLGDWLKETAVLERDLADFLPDWNTARLEEIGRLTDALARRLGNLTVEPVERVEARLKRQEAELDRLRQRLRHVADAVIRSLREPFKDAELERLFRLLNPAILGLPVDTDAAGVTLADRKAAARALQALIDDCRDDAYSGAGVTLALDALPAPDLTQYGDPRRIEAEIEELAAQVERDAQLCRDAREAESLQHEKQVLENERRELFSRQERYAKLVERRAEADAIERRHAEAEAEQARLKQVRDELDARLRGFAEEHHVLRGEADRLQAREHAVQAALAGVTPPPAEWTPDPAEQPAATGDLEDLAARYQRLFQDQQRQDDMLNEILGSIQERTYTRYVTGDEAESLRNLAEAREALPGKEQAAAELWTSIAVGIRENLQNMGSDLDTLRAQVNGINRRLAGIAVSNLKSLKLGIVENPHWTKRIRTIRLQDDMPLFAAGGEADRAFDEIGRLLSERPRIALDDLFNLEFEITMPDDTVRKYPHLDRIESNGTTIAIKVLVNLTLLQYLLGEAEVTIPFYLDECSSLDNDNLQAIVATAAGMGFNAVLASPEAMDAADRLYFMHEQSDGRVVLDPQHTLVELLPAEGEDDDA